MPDQTKTTNRWTEGVCGDGTAILYDGVPASISCVLEALNERDNKDDAYTRDEMRVACRDNYNAALEAACGAVAAVAILANRPECCDSAAYGRKCCGNPNLLVTAHSVAQTIRALKDVARAD